MARLGDWLAFFCLVFFLGAMLTGFYTMVLYAVSIVPRWQSVVCGS